MHGRVDNDKDGGADGEDTKGLRLEWRKELIRTRREQANDRSLSLCAYADVM